MATEQGYRITSYNVCYTKLLRVFHHQYLLRDGKPYIIEITRRCSGDLYPVPVQPATGVVITSYSIHYTKLYEMI